jgi:hypothetical protein
LPEVFPLASGCPVSCDAPAITAASAAFCNWTQLKYNTATSAQSAIAPSNVAIAKVITTAI